MSNQSIRITFVRHSDAEYHNSQGDRFRSLTFDGQEKIKKQGFLLKKKISPQMVLSSPFLRARQTSEILGAILNVSEIQYSNELTPSSDVDDVLYELKSWAKEDLLIIGHNPHITYLVQSLCEEDTPVFETAMAVSLQFSQGIQPKSGRLDFIQRPD